MRLKIAFDCNNAAFEDNPGEINYILDQCKAKLEQLAPYHIIPGEPVIAKLRDTNGNTVGSLTLESNDED